MSCLRVTDGGVHHRDKTFAVHPLDRGRGLGQGPLGTREAEALSAGFGLVYLYPARDD